MRTFMFARVIRIADLLALDDIEYARWTTSNGKAAEPEQRWVWRRVLLVGEDSHRGNHSHVVQNEARGNPMTYHNPASILASGTMVWNTWRRDYPDVQAFEPNLHAVDLRHAQLQGIDFHEADLTEADLQGADLRGADLRSADLRHANLRGADLSDAHLQKAHLHGADLSQAKLCRANLQRADLSNADMRGADLSHANMEKTNLDQAQFAEGSASPHAPRKVNHA